MAEITSYSGERNAEGEMHGRGKATYDDASVYDGKWANNEMCGYGRLVMSNGDVYEGQFQHDKKHGEGRLFWRRFVACMISAVL